MPKPKPVQKHKNKLPDLGLQDTMRQAAVVQAHYNRGDFEAAHAAEIKLKNDALNKIINFKSKRWKTHAEADLAIIEMRKLAKHAMSTMTLNFPRVTA